MSMGHRSEWGGHNVPAYVRSQPSRASSEYAHYRTTQACTPLLSTRPATYAGRTGTEARTSTGPTSLPSLEPNMAESRRITSRITKSPMNCHDSIAAFVGVSVHPFVPWTARTHHRGFSEKERGKPALQTVPPTLVSFEGLGIFRERESAESHVTRNQLADPRRRIEPT